MTTEPKRVPSNLRPLSVAITTITLLTAATLAITRFRAALAGLLGVPPMTITGIAVVIAVAGIGYFVILPDVRRQRLAKEIKRKRAEDNVAARTTPRFRLASFTESQDDQQAFSRTDDVHIHIFNWLEKTRKPILYLSGDSGVGKSSLLNAYVLPRFRQRGARVVHVPDAREPIHRVRDALLTPGVIWKDPNAKADLNTVDLLDAAARYVSSSTSEHEDNRLLIVFDQFEEFLILHERESTEVQDILSLLKSIEQRQHAKLAALLVLRSDYGGQLRSLGLPPLRQGDNYEIVPLLDEPTAIKFLNEKIENDDVARALVREAGQVEETPGRLRFITLNFLGRIYQQSPNQAMARRDTRRIFRNMLAQWVNDPSIRDVSPVVLRQLISPDGTVMPRTIEEIKQETYLKSDVVEHCLLRLAEDGLVRQLADAWRISHDFLARLLLDVVRDMEASLIRRMRPLIGPVLGVLCVALLFFATAIWNNQQYEISRQAFMDAGGALKVNEHGENVLQFRRPILVRPVVWHYVAHHYRASDIHFLDLYGCENLTTLDGMPELPVLTSLDLGGTRLTTLEGMPELPVLRLLDLTGTRLTTLEGLPELPALSRFKLLGTHLTTLEGLPELSSLGLLDLRHTSLTTLDGMPELPALSWLALSNTDLMTLEGMPEFPALRMLKLGSTHLTTLEGMPEQPALTSLDLWNNDLDTLEGMPEFPALTSLDLRQTNVSEEEVKEFRKANPQCDVLWSPRRTAHKRPE